MKAGRTVMASTLSGPTGDVRDRRDINPTTKDEHALPKTSVIAFLIEHPVHTLLVALLFGALVFGTILD